MCWTRIITAPLSISRKIPCGWWHRVVFSLVHAWNEGSVDGGVPSNWMYRAEKYNFYLLVHGFEYFRQDSFLCWYPLISFDSTIDCECVCGNFITHWMGLKSWRTVMSIGWCMIDTEQIDLAQSGSYVWNCIYITAKFRDIESQNLK